MPYTPRLTTYPPEELLAFAREHVPFYRRAYEGLPEKLTLAEAPVIHLKNYWDAYTRDPAELLSGPVAHGLVFASGGSTGEPKYSYYTDADWESGVSLLARSLDGSGLRDGDRLANLFASGYMYASFIYVSDALQAMQRRVLRLPIGVFAPPPDAVRMLRKFRGNVWAGLPMHMLSLVDHMEKEGITDADPRLILFAGESFTADQREHLKRRFQGVTIRSVGYASVDGGMIAYADDGCLPGEHRPFDGATLLEIVDEDTGELIEEADRPGDLIFTNLARRLMPTLRYPTGDRGQWTEPPGTRERKFLLMGRSGESVRLATTNLPVSEIAKLLDGFRDRFLIEQFQLMVTEDDLRPTLTFRLVSRASAEVLENGGRLIVETLLKTKPLLADVINRGTVNPMRVEWIEASDLEVNARTGKTLRVVDRLKR